MHFRQWKRREFIILFGGAAAAWPLAARAQQAVMPVIGYLHSSTPDGFRRQAKVIIAVGAPAPIAAARATTTVPIVFAVPEDPVRLGLVTSVSRPGGNLTGVNFFSAELAGKRLGVLRVICTTLLRVTMMLNSARQS